MAILGFLSDAHGNREALELGIALLRDEGAQTLYFLGDAVGYLPGPAAIDAVKASGALAVMGNHDARVLNGTVDPARDHLYRHRETSEVMSDTHRAVLRDWPESRRVECALGSLLMVHGSPDDPLEGYVYPDSDLTPFLGRDVCAVFMGQTHRPFIRRSAETLFVNVGSCGLPRDRGDLGSACLFDDVTGSTRILRFDIRQATRAALARCGSVAPEVMAVFDRRPDHDEPGERHA